MSEAHKFCLLLVSDLLFRYTQHAGLKKLKVLKYRGHGICGALSTRVCKAGFQEDTDETIKGKVLRDFGPPPVLSVIVVNLVASYSYTKVFWHMISISRRYSQFQKLRFVVETA